jgi:hypothetical protein
LNPNSNQEIILNLLSNSATSNSSNTAQGSGVNLTA